MQCARASAGPGPGPSLRPSACTCDVHAHVMCMCACFYVSLCLCVYVCMSACAHVCMCACVYVITPFTPLPSIFCSILLHQKKRMHSKRHILLMYHMYISTLIRCFRSFQAVYRLTSHTVLITVLIPISNLFSLVLMSRSKISLSLSLFLYPFLFL